LATSWKLLAAAAALLLATGCSAKPSTQAPTPAPSQPAPAAGGALTPAAPGKALTKADEALGKVTVGEPASQVKEELGEPLRHQTSSRTIDVWNYQGGFSVYLDPAGTVVFGLHADKTWTGQTPRGLKIGDSEARVLELYGPPNYKGKNPLIFSPHAYVNDTTGVAIAVDVNAGVVTGIQIIKLPEGTPLNI